MIESNPTIKSSKKVSFKVKEKIGKGT